MLFKDDSQIHQLSQKLALPIEKGLYPLTNSILPPFLILVSGVLGDVCPQSIKHHHS